MPQPFVLNRTQTGRLQACVGALVLLGLLGQAACGGGTTGAGSAGTPAPGPATSVSLAGTLAGSASAPQFNQQPLQVAGAPITLNGAPVAATHLQPGVVLVGQGIREGQGITLQSADLRTELKGLITSLDATAATFKVLDTVVTVNTLTLLEQEASGEVFTPLSFADLAVGDFVSVFGTPQAGGGVLATRVERKIPGAADGPELRGSVSSLDTTAKAFLLGAQPVSYATATVIGVLAEGARVEVEGTLTGTLLTASKVRVEEAMGHDEGSEVEASGALSSLDAAAKQFTLQALKVDYSSASVEGTLAEGAMVEAEGALSPTDPTVLVATKVEVRFSPMGNGASDLEAQGLITALSAADLTLTIGGRTYWTDAQTLLLDRGAALRFDQLLVGDRVQVRALSTRTNAAGQAYASRVERKNSGN